MTDYSAIKARIAKALALQGSSNANEAANAAAMVEKLCREHGITPCEVAEFDEENLERDRVEVKTVLSGKRISQGEAFLLASVATYFDGHIVRCLDGRVEVFATAGNLVQVEIYFNYLQSEMKQQAEAAKFLAMQRGQKVQGFLFDFYKGFAIEINSRLLELKKDRSTNGIPASENQNHIPGLALTRKSDKDNAKAMAFVKIKHPNTTKGISWHTSGIGDADGRAAGKNVSLNKQIDSGSSKRLAACNNP